jgi:monofunctional biosynthetic peptidoglycan transglycosylase
LVQSELIFIVIKRIFKFLLAVICVFIAMSLLLVLPFRWVNPPLTMVMVDRWIEAPMGYQTKQNWLSWQQIPKRAALAVVAAEDQRFPLHSGMDFTEIRHAISAKLDGKKLRGASTISQQVARNMYLWTGRSWFRKALEVWFTLLIEVCWGKQRILEIYLNIAEWGNGIFGMEAASVHHFSTPLANISPTQMALLAAVLPNPIRFNPARPSAYIVNKAKWNLEQQAKLGGTRWLAQIK